VTASHRAGFVPRPVETPDDLRRLMQEDFTFSDQQFAVITAPLGPHVVIAGAGSGKTTVMAARVVWLVATGQVTPDQVLGLTFTTKAAHELATRIRAGLRDAGILRPPGSRLRGDAEEVDELQEPTVATYNAYAAGLLTEHGLRIGHEPDIRVIADASRYQLAARAIARYTGRVELLSDHPPTVINYLLALDGAMAEHLLTPADVRAFQARERPGFEAAKAEETHKTKIAEVEKVLSTFDRREELLGLVEAYQRLKTDLGLMDFSDQIELGARLASQCPEVGSAERERFRVVLLDEYQDTSVAQARMLSRLFSGPSPDHGRGHPVTAVGDPNQAIYGWRGASVSNILGFGVDFPRADGSPEVDAYSLTVNRRSDERVLELANELAAPLYSRMPQVLPLEAKPGADPGAVRTAVLETYADELGWLPEQVKQARAEMAEPAWSEIGVLTRDNAHAADVFDALTAAEIPVEIVGLQGLLRLPEVAEVVATLTLLHDLTANAELLTLLTGPRWAIGARDLALLGRRARRLAGGRGAADRDRLRSVDEELAEAVAGADPTEVVSLGDALDDPGDADYSPQARERFALLSAELRTLRAYAGEPLLDLVRRIIDTTGIDVELASSTSPAAQARRDNLDLFVKAVADFQAVDGDVSLPALLAYLQAEDEYGAGLDVATPTEADSVKLLTVHRAKGLEWNAVFLVGVADDKFPTGRTRTKWTAGPGVLPYPLRGDARDLPALRGYSCADLKDFALRCKAHELEEELRLGYVAFTRARHLLSVSSYCWSPSRQGALGPSAYQQTVREVLDRWGEKPTTWLDKPAKGESNPLHALDTSRPWPMEAHTGEVERRREAAALVRAAVAELAAGAVEGTAGGTAEGTVDGGLAARDHERDLTSRLTAEQAQRVAEWDDELDRLLEEARADRADTVEVPLPSSLSATSLARLRDDPIGLARDLARPMPRKPSPAARFGTRFHAWVEARFGQQQLVGLDELPGRGDAGIEDEQELQQLIDRFTAGPFGDRVPHAVEPPFALVLGGQVVRGRIDAVYATGSGFLVVDWKTNQQQTADPLQLAIYRLAWAELGGVPVEQVSAAFYYVRTGVLDEHHDLPGREELEAIIAGGGRPAG
jgi:DNA helicase-2/ATP-dependent DNA helicase PcrA